MAKAQFLCFLLALPLISITLSILGLDALPAVFVTATFSVMLLLWNGFLAVPSTRSTVFISALFAWSVLCWSYSISEEIADLKFLRILTLLIIPSILIASGRKSTCGDPDLIVKKNYKVITFSSLLFIVLFVFFSAPYPDGRLIVPGIENPIWVSRLAGIMFLLHAIQLLSTKTRRLVSLSIMAGLSIILLLAGSRAVLLSVLFSLVYFGTVTKNKTKIFGLASILTLLVILAYFAFNESYVFDTNFYSLAYRLGAYTDTLDAIAIRPWLGFGLGSSGLILYKEDLFAYPHNIVMEILLESGLSGLLLLMLPTFIALKSTKDRPQIKAVFIFFALNAFSSGDIVGNAGLLYTIAYTSSLPRRSK